MCKDSSLLFLEASLWPGTPSKTYFSVRWSLYIAVLPVTNAPILTDKTAHRCFYQREITTRNAEKQSQHVNHAVFLTVALADDPRFDHPYRATRAGCDSKVTVPFIAWSCRGTNSGSNGIPSEQNKNNNNKMRVFVQNLSSWKTDSGLPGL